MKTKNGTCIDVLASDGLPPLDLDLNNNITLLRMDHGSFKLRLHTPHKTIVTLSLDDVELLRTKVNPGVHLFAEDSAQKQLEFKPASASSQAATQHGSDDSTAPTLINVPGVEEDAPAPKVRIPFLGRGGRLRVNLSYFKEDEGATVKEVIFLSEQKEFQFNAGSDHDRAVVENFHRFVPTSDGEAVQPICGCCRVH